jgi:hypothetical protein
MISRARPGCSSAACGARRGRTERGSGRNRRTWPEQSRGWSGQGIEDCPRPGQGKRCRRGLVLARLIHDVARRCWMPSGAMPVLREPRERRECTKTTGRRKPASSGGKPLLCSPASCASCSRGSIGGAAAREGPKAAPAGRVGPQQLSESLPGRVDASRAGGRKIVRRTAAKWYAMDVGQGASARAPARRTSGGCETRAEAPKTTQCPTLGW